MSTETNATVPIVIDLGRAKRSKIKALKRGKGKLLDEVMQALGEVWTGLEGEAAGKQLVPVIVLVKEKTVRRKASLFPFLP